MAKRKMSKWDERIEKARKYLGPTWEHGRRVYEAYLDKREDLLVGGVRRANFFYANVNTLKESLFNSMPQVDVSRLHKGDFDDDVSRVAALILQRSVSYEVQCSDAFREAVESAILDRLVPGLGVCWLTFGVDMTPASDIEGDDAAQPVLGSERIQVETVYWEDFIYAPSRTWSVVPWAGRRRLMTRAEIVDKWGDDVFSEVAAVKQLDNVTPKQITDGKYEIYEIWDKTTRTVVFTAMGLEQPIEVVSDPYGLVGFFPFPEPLIANVSTAAYLPVTDYHVSQDQYIQLDVLYGRISLIVDAIKVSGVYASDSPEVQKMFTNAENQLIPVDNWAMFAEKGGLKGIIDWYPIDTVASVLQQLQAQFEAVKSVLYEISGMSDIMRGASNQYETAAAQGIKAQFASVRMNGYQRDVSRFVDQMFNIIAQMIVKLYGDEKLQAIVGPLSPADAQYAPQAVELLRNDFLRMCRVAVRADSLVQADWALEKTQRMELMGYIGQFLGSSMPLLEQNPDISVMLVALLKWSVTGYRGSQEIEGVIDRQLDAMLLAQQQAKANPQPPPPSPEQIKAQSDQQYMQMEMAIMQQKAQSEQQLAAMSAQTKQMDAQLDMSIQQQKAEQQAQLAMLEQQHKQQLFEMQMAMERQKMAFDAQLQQLKLESAEAQAQIKAAAQRDKARGDLIVSAVKNQQQIEHAQAMDVSRSEGE